MEKKVIQNSKFKISALTWNEKFDLPDGFYSVSDIQDYFEYIFKKHGEKTDNPPLRFIKYISIYLSIYLSILYYI